MKPQLPILKIWFWLLVIAALYKWYQLPPTDDSIIRPSPIIQKVY